jgi:anti-sigma factor RsiW
MNCADAVTRLSAALDGELSGGEAGDVQRHLVACEACARRYRTLQQVRAAVRATAFAPVDAARFDARVHERVRHDARSTRISAAWIAAAAALVISVSSAVLMLQEHAGIAPRLSAETAVLPSDLGGWPGLNEGRAGLAMDCGLSEASSCVIDAPPGLMAGN